MSDKLDSYLDVTGADDVEITISDPLGGTAVGNQPVIHMTISKEKRIIAQVRICRIKGEVLVSDRRKKPTSVKKGY